MHKSPGQSVDYFDLLQVFSFDTNKNEKFIENYFRGLYGRNRRLLILGAYRFWHRESITFCISCLYSSLLRLTTIASLKQHAHNKINLR